MAQQRGVKRAAKVLKRQQKKGKQHKAQVMRAAEHAHHGHDHSHDHADHDHDHKAKKEK